MAVFEDQVQETLAISCRGEGFWPKEKPEIWKTVRHVLGEKLAEVVKAALFRVLCYRHSSQLIARVVVKDVDPGFAVSVYADIDYETPWLKVHIKP